MKRNTFLIVCLFWASGISVAAESAFYETAEDMATALAGPRMTRPPAIKTRSITIGGGSRGISLVMMKKDIGDTVVTKEVQMVEEQRPVVNLRILFEYDSHSISDESVPLLDELGKALQSDGLQGLPVYITGHTDSDGDAAYNLKLSMMRGEAVKEYLESNFPVAKRITVIGLGEAVPLVANDSPEHRQLNRRVEVSTVSPVQY